MEILNKINDLDKRKAIVASINEGVKIRWDIEKNKGDIKDIAQHLKEMYEIPVGETNKIIETIFNNNLEDQKEKLDNLSDVVDILSGEFVLDQSDTSDND